MYASTVVNGRVNGMLSFSKKQKTSKSITIGSSRAQMKRAYPQAKYAEGPEVTLMCSPGRLLWP
jgi:hypothetical protein